jgi:hypothetical protein
MTECKSRKSTEQRGAVPGEQYPGVCGNVAHWVEHFFEEGILIHPGPIHAQNGTLLDTANGPFFQEADLSSWETGDCEQLRVYVRDENDWEQLPVVGWGSRCPERPSSGPSSAPGAMARSSRRCPWPTNRDSTASTREPGSESSSWATARASSPEPLERRELTRRSFHGS